MAQALLEAEKAAELDEVPVGAVILRGKEIVGRGHNLTRTDRDPTAHAELVAIRNVSCAGPQGRLEDCTLYVTLEPCAMCAGAIVLARLSRVVFGTHDPKAGACGSLRNVISDARLNHRVDLTTGILKQPCSDLLRAFFKSKRK